ncbi:MAG: hypothetical protein OEN00_12305, partial [Gemmatimonadota bacterium]|nr:hypothetical protein [Gemmatimonadota bacterium]
MRRIIAMAATLTALSGSQAADTTPNDEFANVAAATPVRAITSTRALQEAPRGRSTAQQREAVSITVYNQNFGLVREVRTLDLPRGLANVEYADVASGIQPETVHIRPLGRTRFSVLEQNYQYDLLNPQKLLEKYVGRTVTVYRTNTQTGEERAVEAEVLSVNGGPILR